MCGNGAGIGMAVTRSLIRAATVEPLRARAASYAAAGGAAMRMAAPSLSGIATIRASCTSTLGSGLFAPDVLQKIAGLRGTR